MSAPVATTKVLTFPLAAAEYGIDIKKVREILAMVAVTPLPRAPQHLKGVINLRGRIVPVVDLRLALGLAPAAYGHETCIVVVEADNGGDGATPVGCIVDTVTEVLQVEADRLEAAPQCAGGALDCITGLAKFAERVLILLDIDRVVGDPIAALSGTAAA